MGALEDFAGCAIAAMKILKGFNRDDYNMVWESCKYEFQEAIKTYRESMKKKERALVRILLFFILLRRKKKMDGLSLEHKGYRTTIMYSFDDGVYHGKVEDIPDLVIFEGDSIEKAEANFKEAVDDYIRWNMEE